jgi:hypothetical protein
MKAKSGHLSLTDFISDSVSFEIRYDYAYLIWDRAGQLWSELASKYPEMKLSDAMPDTQNFNWKNIHTFSVGAEKAAVTTLQPDTIIKDFVEASESLLEAVVRSLQVQVLTRMGLRRIFGLECPNREIAVRHLLATGAVNVPSHPIYGLEVKTPLPEYSLRWETDNIGVTTRLRTEHRKAEIELPPIFGVHKVPKIEQDFFVYDVDYYTKKPVSVGQVGVRDWTSNGLQLIKSNSNQFLRMSEATND